MQEISLITKIIHWMTANDTRPYIALTCLNACALSTLFSCVAGSLIIRYPPPKLNLHIIPSQIATHTIPPFPTPTKTHPKITRSLTPTPNQPTIPPTTTDTPTPILTETLTPAPTVPIILKSMTKNRNPGQDAYIEIQTLPNTSCSITYKTPMGNLSEAEGLKPTQSDQEGICRWEWMIGTNTTLGTGSITVTVQYGSAKFLITIKEP